MGSQVEEQVNFSVDRLMFNTASLEDSMTVEEAGLETESSIDALVALDGGKRKRKKKVYTKPKKVKHVHKKRSKAALEYFQVDASGKVIELKQKTTQGQGWFMADHQDRHVCGATGHTMWKTGPDGKRLPPPVQKHVAKEVNAVVKKAAKKKKK